MILIKPSYSILGIMDGFGGATKLIEYAGRTCYKSEDKITTESAKQFVKMIKSRGHYSVLEHSCLTVKFVIDRGVSHELVRHRLCAFSQESTRYCNYKGGVTFVIPPWIKVNEGNYTGYMYADQDTEHPAFLWLYHMWKTERVYIDMLESGWSPQQARSVLPNSLKTEIVVTANFREWLHIFNLRCSPAAHPQMREIMIPLQSDMQESFPEIFG